MTNWAIVLGASVLFAAGDHASKNRLYSVLITEGAVLNDSRGVPLPAPSMADGLSAIQQRRVIESVVREVIPERHRKLYSHDKMVDDSPVAPFLFRTRVAEQSDPEQPVYGVDLWFVAYGDFGKLSREDVGQSFKLAGDKNTTLTAIGGAELAKRGIELTASEQYVRATSSIFNQVQLGITSHSQQSQTPHSVLHAASLDERFAMDPELANQWRRILNPGSANRALGPSQPYHCLSNYLKITKLVEPPGALFIEFHQVYAEPDGWFGGKNIIRPKLFLKTRSEMREFRVTLKQTRDGN